ncbi:MAG TPA: multicopper oxidase domain-containing protein [Mycobacteriales bacterium]|nr:multicopper oxidase domain-containing protein [Mycobacteriales bacterium]
MLEVEPRRYRFRVLNGCNSRFLILKLASSPPSQTPGQQTPGQSPPAALPFWLTGTEGGFLPQPVRQDQLLLGPAERTDVIVDFTDVSVGTALYVVNDGPDEPFQGLPNPSPNPATTGQVMKLVVVPLSSTDTSVPPSALSLPAFPSLGPASTTRRVSLNEEPSQVVPGVTPIAALLGTVTADGGGGIPLRWDEPITENPALDTIEVWEIYNFTPDAHPIHIHEVQFQVVDRQPMDSGDPRLPDASETGFKDTVIAYPREITRVKALFDLPGQYVWHCHIVEHEDNEMMRPYHIGPIPPDLP